MVKNGLRVALFTVLCIAINGCSHKEETAPAQSPDQQAMAAVQTLSRLPASERQSYLTTHPDVAKSLRASTSPEVKEQINKVMQPQ